MKRIYKYLGAAALFASIVSCDLNKTPVFDEAEAFAAFDKSSISVDEDEGKVVIPVSIASVVPVKVAVAYAVQDGQNADASKNAVAGKNYVVTDESAVLSFDGEQRTANIEIEIKDYPGVYTGDLSFELTLVSAGSINLGANSTCTVKISDLDHPLADVLGVYTEKGESIWNGAFSCAPEFLKDDEDVTVVWIESLNPEVQGMKVYGNVSEDHNVITVPLGQNFVLPNGKESPGVLWGFDEEEPLDSGSIVLTKNEAGDFVADLGYAIAVFDGEELLGFADVVNPEFTLTKK